MGMHRGGKQWGAGLAARGAGCYPSPARAGLSEVAEIGEEAEGGRAGRGVWRLLDKEMMKRERYIYQGGGDRARGGGW